MNTYQSDKQEDRVHDQQNMGISSDKDMTDGRQDNNSRSEAPRIRSCSASRNVGHMSNNNI